MYERFIKANWKSKLRVKKVRDRNRATQRLAKLIYKTIYGEYIKKWKTNLIQ
jgi:hypothetical protein